jgi:MarR family transcriptional regulator, transcriptional regulator for hemolysin
MSYGSTSNEFRRDDVGGMSMRLSHLVGRTAAALRHRLETDMAALGASFPEFLILYVVAAHPGCSQREVAAQVGVERQTMSHHLDRLEAEGLVARRRDPDDRRILRVHPTAAGRRRLAKLDAIVEGLEAHLNAQLSEREAAVLHKALTRLADSVEPPPRLGR